MIHSIIDRTHIRHGMFAVVLGVLVFGILPLGCDPFINDSPVGDNVEQGGYLYLLDREAVRLVMLDGQLRQVKNWDLLAVTGDSSLQGITYDGSYLWVSSAGAVDKIMQIDAGGDSLTILKSFDAPPTGKGTIRDIAWDGTYLWAANSGSLSSSIPPKLYKLNPLDGAILGEFSLPTRDPRGLTALKTYTDEYGRTTSGGICYTDISTNMVYRFHTELAVFETLFSAPVPPRGASYVYPVGITQSGSHFWLVNSSNTADHLYKLTLAGHVESMFDLPFSYPGAIVSAAGDVRIPAPPVILALSPPAAIRGISLQVEIYGTGFKAGPGLTADFGDGITVDSLQFVYATQLRASITVDSAARIGKRNVVITNPGGQSAQADSAFEITSVAMTPHLWLAEQDMDSLYRIRVGDNVVVNVWDTREVAPGGSPQGVAYDGTNIWLCASGSDRRIFKLDASGSALTVLNFMAAPTASGTLRGIAIDNGSLYLAVSTLGRIYKMDLTTGEVQDSMNAPGIEPRGVAIANGRLYCNDTSLDSVYVFNEIARTWSGVFATPTPAGGSPSNRFATGLAWDGANFWIANSTTTFDHVYKVTPTGTVLTSFEGPRIGAAQLTGLVYTPN
jgi:hypothetical protein